MRYESGLRRLRENRRRADMAADTAQARRKSSAKEGGARAESEASGGDKKLGVAAVDRALSILSAFVDNEPSLSLSRIAQRTGLYKSTTLRLIDSLEAAGYIRRLQSGDYQLGPTLFRLGMQYQKG